MNVKIANIDSKKCGIKFLASNSHAVKLEYNFETHELIGDAPAEIAKAVKEYDCHLVVMGTRGMSKLGNLLMGSVATRVIHEVDVPVLLVK